MSSSANGYNNKGILKYHENENEKEEQKHVKWDEEKLKESELVKLTIPKGQICEPKTPFFHGDSVGSFTDDDTGAEDGPFYLRKYNGTTTDEDSNCYSDDNSSSTGFNNNNNNSNTNSCCEWESEVESINGPSVASEEEERRKKSERFKALRAQHYFMKNSFKKANNDDDFDDEDGTEQEQKQEQEQEQEQKLEYEYED